MARRGYRWKGEPRRSSRRLDGWAPAGNTECASTKPFYLPYELLTDILSRLDKKALKTARLACKHWKQFATPLLFDRIWVSPRTKDMSVFTSLTETPDLAMHIREVRYDQTIFNPIDDLHKFMSLLLLNNFVLVHGLKPRAQSHPGFSLGQCGSAVYRAPRQPMEQAIDEFHLRDFMEEAYNAWCCMVEDEATVLNSYSFFERLTEGFELLPHLTSLVFDENMWSNTMDEFGKVSRKQSLEYDFSGSPLARSWHPFYLRPVIYENYSTNDGQGSKIVMQALASARKIIERFEGGGCDFMGTKFQSSWLQPSFVRSSLSISIQVLLQQLRSLSLKVQMQEDDHLETPSTLGYLPLVLQRAYLLNKLRLIFYSHEPNGGRQRPANLIPKRIKFDHVFCRPCQYPHLRDLVLVGMEMDAWRLEDFLSDCCKNIKSLELRNLSLSNGCWEGVIQSLRCIQAKRKVDLTRCYLGFGGTLSHRDGQIFAIKRHYPSEQDEAGVEVDDINDYILYGGEHPCLSDSDLEGREWEWWFESLPKYIQEGGMSWFQRGLQEVRRETAGVKSATAHLHKPCG